jgi:hypothetical protein
MEDEENVQSTPSLDDAILSNALGPAEVESEVGRVRAHNIKDQIELAKFLAAKKATGGGGLPIRIGKIEHGGTT